MFWWTGVLAPFHASQLKLIIDDVIANVYLLSFYHL